MPRVPVVTFDQKTGRYVMNTSFSTGGSSRRSYTSTVDSQARINHLNSIYRQVQARQPQHKKRKKKKKAPGEGYQDPAHASKSRVEADKLNIELQNQAMNATALLNAQGGNVNTQKDAIGRAVKPAGSALKRTLDLASRGLYGTAEFVDSTYKAGKGLSPEHPDWVPSEFGNPDKSGYWTNKKTGKEVYRPGWGDTVEGTSPVGALKEGLKGAVRGVTGKDKTTYSQVLNDNNLLHGKPAAALGFTMDLVGDPLMHVSLGTSQFEKRLAKSLDSLTDAERLAIEKAAKSAASKKLAATGKKASKSTTREAYKRELKAELERAGVSKSGKPIKTVIEDINSSTGKHSVERAAKDKVEAALADPFWSKSNQAKITRDAKKLYRAEMTVKGTPYVVKDANAAAAAARDSARNAFARKVGQDVMDEIATRQAMRHNLQVDFKIHGKTVASSEKLGKVIEKSARTVRETRGGQALARTFRTDAQTGEAIHRIQRQSYNVSAAQFEAEAKDIKRVFTQLGLKKPEREMVARGIESGSTAGFTQPMLDAYKYAKDHLDAAFQREVDAGARTAADYADNYLPHTYKRTSYKKGIGSSVKPSKRGAQKFATLEEAANAGARPVTDIADILVHRLAKSHRVAASHQFMNEVAARFGMDLSGKEVRNRVLRGLEDRNVLIEANKIDGLEKFFPPHVYLDQDVAHALTATERIFTNADEITRLGKLFDGIQSRIKFLQTAPNPSFHLRNSISDIYMNYLAGVKDVKWYHKSLALVMHPEADKSAVKLILKGTHLDGNDIIRMYDAAGLRAGFFHADASIIPRGTSYVTSPVSGAIRSFSEGREDMTRLANYMYSLDDVAKKYTPRNKKFFNDAELEQISQEAAKRVRKYNYDYQDLTVVEQKVFRRVIPFYTFMRKNIGIQLETLFTQPGKMTVPTKGMYALSQLLGQDGQDNVLPGLMNATPSWISEAPAIEQQGLTSSDNANFIQPDLPYNQLQQMFGGFAEGSTPMDHLRLGSQGLIQDMADRTTEVVRAPLSYGLQKDLTTFQDQPQSLPDTAVNLFPVGKMLQPALAKHVGHGIFLSSDKAGSPTYVISINGERIHIGENAANWITGLGFRKVTPERMKSALRRKQDVIIQIYKKAKEDYANSGN